MPKIQFDVSVAIDVANDVQVYFQFVSTCYILKLSSTKQTVIRFVTDLTQKYVGWKSP